MLPDLSSSRLALAMKMGATHTVLVSRDERSKDVASRIIEQLGVKPEFTLETSGAQSSLQTAIYVSGSQVYLSPDMITFCIIL